MLVIRTSYDDETAMSYRWAEEILAGCPDCEPLNGPQAVRSAVRELIPRHRSVAFYGHGKSLSLLGQKGRPIIDLITAVSGVLGGKVVVAIACSSARILGAFVVLRGAKAYLGYTRKFRLFADAESTFREVANAPVLEMRRGATAQEALEFCRQEYRRKIDYYLDGGRNVPNAPGIAARLQWNLDYLVLRGDGTATL